MSGLICIFLTEVSSLLHNLSTQSNAIEVCSGSNFSLEKKCYIKYRYS